MWLKKNLFLFFISWAEAGWSFKEFCSLKSSDAKCFGPSHTIDDLGLIYRSQNYGGDCLEPISPAFLVSLTVSVM